MDVHEMSKKGVAARRRKAVERRVKVAELKGNGMSGTQIAEVLGENPRTIYNDFSILKSESK